MTPTGLESGEAAGDTWVGDAMLVVLTIVLVLLNGFFVAVEFALVKLRPSQVTEMVSEGRAFANSTKWLMKRLDRALSACQLGITMASLGLGWIGEPAIARLLDPVFVGLGITSPAVVHTVSFIIAFTIITALHLVIGEQAPKIYALRRPDPVSRWCSVPLKAFYVVSFPLLAALQGATNVLLRWAGVEGGSGHGESHSQEEIRALLGQAHAMGELTRTEHKLLNAVFEFDDTICRQIMVPRVDVEFLDADMSIDDVAAYARTSKHTRYPLCEGSLDNVLGFVHIKDLLGEAGGTVNLRDLVRAPKYVPETIHVSKLLGHFRSSKQHMAFVIDEHGTVVGIVTMENVLERIVGSVQDEFDMEDPEVVPDGAGRFMVQGGADLTDVNRAAGTHLVGQEVDTLGGLIMERLGRVPEPGDRVQLEGVTAEVLEVKSARALRVRLILDPEEVADAGG